MALRAVSIREISVASAPWAVARPHRPDQKRDNENLSEPGMEDLTKLRVQAPSVRAYVSQLGTGPHPALPTK